MDWYEVHVWVEPAPEHWPKTPDGTSMAPEPFWMLVHAGKDADRAMKLAEMYPDPRVRRVFTRVEEI